MNQSFMKKPVSELSYIIRTSLSDPGSRQSEKSSSTQVRDNSRQTLFGKGCVPPAGTIRGGFTEEGQSLSFCNRREGQICGRG